MKVTRYFVLLASLVLPIAAQASKVDMTWIGNQLFTGHSAFYSVDPNSGLVGAIFFSQVEGDCATVRPTLGQPNSRALAIYLNTPQPVAKDGNNYHGYSVFMSALDLHTRSEAQLIALDDKGESLLVDDNSMYSMWDGESWGQHGVVLTKAQNSNTLVGDYDLSFGGLHLNKARRVWGTFTAERCDLTVER